MSEVIETDSQRGIMNWLLRRTRGVRAMWFLCIASRIANQLLMVAILVLAGYSIVERELASYLWWIVGLSLIKAALRYLEHYAGHWVAFTMLTRLRTEFYDSLVPQAPAVVKGQAAAEMSERATRDIDRIEVFFAHTIPPAVAAIVVPGVAVIWSWLALGWQFAVVILVASVVMMVIPQATRTLSWQDNRSLAAANANIATHVGDSVQGLREVVAFGAQDRRREQWLQLEGVAEKLRMRIRARAAFRSGALLAVELGTMGLLIAWLGSVDFHAAIYAVLTWIALWAPLRGVDDFADGLDEALASAERVRSSINAEPTVADSGKLAVPQGRVRAGDTLMTVDDLDFSYDGITPALTGVSLEILAGTWTFVAGVSGSGKSTLAALLARGWDPGAGRIRYRGVEVADLSLADLRSSVALVVQRPALLEATLKDNLCLSVPDAEEARLWQVLDCVGLSTWAQSLPEGLATPLSTDGANVSGGQVQRIAIARALLTEPELLILDEATSQLDEDTALAVRSQIRTIFPELTVLEISHQVDRIPMDAQVSVFDAGRLVESGTAAELATAEGGYLGRLLDRVG